jgi:hypothetical protein
LHDTTYIHSFRHSFASVHRSYTGCLVAVPINSSSDRSAFFSCLVNFVKMGVGYSEPDMNKTLFNMKLTSKQLATESKKFESKAKAEVRSERRVVYSSRLSLDEKCLRRRKKCLLQ